jgi:hypothetical protein
MTIDVCSACGYPTLGPDLLLLPALGRDDTRPIPPLPGGADGHSRRNVSHRSHDRQAASRTARRR